MSTKAPYTPHPNSSRLPFYGLLAFATIICIIFWRSCHFSGSDPAAPRVEATEGK